MPKPNESIEYNDYKITNLKVVNEKYINLQMLEFQKMTVNDQKCENFLIHKFTIKNS